MQPFDYSISVATPFESVLQGYQGGSAVRADVQKRDAQQLAIDQQRQMQTTLSDLANKKDATASDYARVMTQFPKLSEELGRSWSTLNGAQQQSKLSQGAQVYAAINAGRNDIAEQQLRDHAAAARNSGDEATAKQSETLADLVKLHPETARTSVALSLAAQMGPEKFAATFGNLGQESRAQDQAPADLAKKQADAATAATKAKYAEPEAVLDLEKKGWDITALKADIGFKKEQNRIAAMNAAISREGNDLKRQELTLKVQEKSMELNDKVRARAAEAESGAATIDNFLNTIERIKTSKGLNDVLGAVEGSSLYPNTLAGVANTFNPVGGSSADERANAVALIETLGSQAFLSQIPAMKGQGALSNAEGEKLQSALTNLSRKQSEPQFKANLDEAARIMKKARENLAAKTGVPLGKPDTPAAPGARPPLSSFQK